MNRNQRGATTGGMLLAMGIMVMFGIALIALSNVIHADDPKPAASKPEVKIVEARVTEDIPFPLARVQGKDGETVPRPDTNANFRYTLGELYQAANLAAEWIKTHPDTKGVRFGARIRPDGATVLMVGQDVPAAEVAVGTGDK